MGLEETIKALNAAYDDAVLISPSDSVLQRECVPTGSMKLDIALGGSGLVRGRIIELFGPESSGKSTLSLHMMAAHQKIGKVVLVDLEHAFDPNYAKNLGVDMDEILFSQPDNAEQAMTIIESVAACGEVPLVVVDSVAALSPRAEVEGDSGDSNMGLIARLMGQHLRKLTHIASKNKCSIVYINQLRANIGSMGFGPKTVTTGGNALKYFSSIRLDIRRIKTLEKGIISRVKVAKNKTSVPFKEAEFQINFGTGIDHYQEVLDLAIEKEIVAKSGSWFSYNESRLGHGAENVKQFLRENNEVLEEIKCLL